MKQQKRGNKKLFLIGGFFLIVLLITSVLITASDNSLSDFEPLNNSIPSSAYEYVESFAENNGINKEDIESVSEVDFNSLPKEVDIENVNDANLAIYQINYTNPSGTPKKLFMITYTVEQLKSQGDIIVSQDKREFINFGFNKEIIGSGFLESATGVSGSLENGYVMMRSGSITGISTSLEVLEGQGDLELVIYKNGKPIQFGNSFVVKSSGVVKDYDIQSKDTVNFVEGDVISAYIKSSSGIKWTNVITLVEIITN